MRKLSKPGIIGLGLVVVSLIGLGILLFNIYRQPMGPALNIRVLSTTPTASSIAFSTKTPAVGLAETPVTVKVATSSPAPTATVGQNAACGEIGAWNILVLGSDSSDLHGTAGSDLVRVMRVDFGNKKINMFAFTRDLWVNTQGLGLANPTIEATGLGKVFYEALVRSAYSKERDKMIDATNTSANMMAQNFELRSDHYITVDLSRIPAIVDTVGGIPIDVPVDTTDPWIGMVIKAGPQTLNGQQAMAYARAKPDSDFARIQRDNLLIEALRKKVLDPAVWIKIPALFTQFQQAIATDFSPEQIAHLACLLKEVPQSAIIQDEVRKEWTSSGPQGFLLWDKLKVTNRLKEMGIVE